MEIIPMTGALGAEVLGADLRNENDAAAIVKAFTDYGVLAIRGQNISPEDHIAFAGRFGKININRFFTPVASHPQIAEVRKEADQKEAIGEIWHTDHSYDAVPAMGSILHAIDMPDVGGDTMFASMSTAYDALSEPIKHLVSGLTAQHDTMHVFLLSKAAKEARAASRLGEMKEAPPNAQHPMVIRHPFSGRKCLYVNPQFTTGIIGLSDIESAGILNMLYDHCANPDFQCRVRWRKGDVTMWDNRSTWHKAVNDYQGKRRYMHRITVEGVALVAG